MHSIGRYGIVSVISNDRTASGIFGMHGRYGPATQNDVGSRSSCYDISWWP